MRGGHVPVDAWTSRGDWPPWRHLRRRLKRARITTLLFCWLYTLQTLKEGLYTGGLEWPDYTVGLEQADTIQGDKNGPVQYGAPGYGPEGMDDSQGTSESAFPRGLALHSPLCSLSQPGGGLANPVNLERRVVDHWTPNLPNPSFSAGLVR